MILNLIFVTLSFDIFTLSFDIFTLSFDIFTLSFDIQNAPAALAKKAVISALRSAEKTKIQISLIIYNI